MPTPPDQPHTPNIDDRNATCPDEILLAGWCDGLLEEGERELLDVHVAGCARCAELVAGLRSELDASVDASQPFVAQTAIDRAAALVLTPRSSRSWHFIAFRVAAIAAAVALAPIGVWIGYSLSQSYAAPRAIASLTPTIAETGETDDDASSRFAYLDAGYEESSSDPFELLGLPMTDRSAS